MSLHSLDLGGDRESAPSDDHPASYDFKIELSFGMAALLPWAKHLIDSDPSSVISGDDTT